MENIYIKELKTKTDDINKKINQIIDQENNIKNLKQNIDNQNKIMINYKDNKNEFNDLKQINFK
jgi:hypothetical protein